MFGKAFVSMAVKKPMNRRRSGRNLVRHTSDEDQEPRACLVSHCCSFADVGGPASLWDDVKNVGVGGGGGPDQNRRAADVASPHTAPSAARCCINCSRLWIITASYVLLSKLFRVSLQILVPGVTQMMIFWYRVLLKLWYFEFLRS
jgi:hypothetical protein